MKIIGRRVIGWEAVYDIGLAGDHNFLLANGVVAANCFNKSHSTAYGYVTYQTAFLKAHFPVEYMAALLTSTSGDQDKVQRYIATCLSMGIEVLPPDVNRSRIDFTPVGEKILFGLSAVRNVGQGAIEAILTARERGGAFQSLGDFCDRVDSRVLNRRAIEALINCGAMDELHPQRNRNQLLADLPLVLEWAQGRAKDRAIGQVNLFDLLGGSTSTEPTGSYDPAPTAPPVPDLPESEKLRQEKELLGFYVSNHPLKDVHRSAAMVAPVSLGDLEHASADSTISAIVLITELKPITTKKGDRMAIAQLEDLTGQAEAVIFPKAYERIHEHLRVDHRLLVWGTVDQRDERLQLVIEDAEPLEEVKLVIVQLPVEKANDIQAQNRLAEVLKQQGGELPKVPVVVKVTDGRHHQYVRLGAQFRVEDADRAYRALSSAGFETQAKELLRLTP